MEKCFLNGLELQDILIDTNPNFWSFYEDEPDGIIGVRFDLFLDITINNTIEMCIDGTSNTTVAPSRIIFNAFDDNIFMCDQVSDIMPDFCGM